MTDSPGTEGLVEPSRVVDGTPRWESPYPREGDRWILTGPLFTGNEVAAAIKQELGALSLEAQTPETERRRTELVRTLGQVEYEDDESLQHPAPEVIAEAVAASAKAVAATLARLSLRVPLGVSVAPPLDQLADRVAEQIRGATRGTRKTPPDKVELDERNNEMVARLRAKMATLPSGF